MKKFLVMLFAAILLVVGVSAAETVIYENDFSDPATLWDFTQYRMQWEIRDGGLYLTEEPAAGAGKINLATDFGFILYNGGTNLSNYVIDVDLMNARTQSGVIFRSQQNLVKHKNSAFCGYISHVSHTVTQGVIGAGSTKGEWAGNLSVGGNHKSLHPGANIHINVIVKDQKVGVKMTNIDDGKLVFDKVYTIGSNSQYDAIYTEGTFGLRMKAKYNDSVAAGVSYFDNLVVTTANEAVPAVTPIDTTATRIDVKDVTPVYTNNFDGASDIDDFIQLYGTWEVQDGKLYMTDVEDASHSLLIYDGDENLKTLTDYVVDVDMYNIQTQGGVIIRSDVEKIKEDKGTTDGNNFYGYFGYNAFAGNQAALGFGASNGDWGGLVTGPNGNVASPADIYKPTANIHMQVATKGDTVQVTVSEIGGTVLWVGYAYHDFWDAGSFGFRLYAKLRDDGLDNVANTAFDNLVVSTFPDSGKTEIKMTIDSLTAFVNGTAKTLDAAPIIRNSRTMLPVRFVAENLGATVGWDDATKTVTVKGADVSIEIVIGATTAKVNGAEIALDSPAFIENSRTYLPVRVVAENLGATVAWDDATKTATLTK